MTSDRAIAQAFQEWAEARKGAGQPEDDIIYNIEQRAAELDAQRHPAGQEGGPIPRHTLAAVATHRCDMCGAEAVPDPVVGCVRCGWDEMQPIGSQPAPPADVASGEGVEAAFSDWLVEQMPPGTVINSPQWWAPRIAHAYDRIRRLAAGQQCQGGELPPLPESVDYLAESEHPGYDADQMRAYGHQCRAEGVVVDEAHGKKLHDLLFRWERRGEVMMQHAATFKDDPAMNNWCGGIARAIEDVCADLRALRGEGGHD